MNQTSFPSPKKLLTRILFGLSLLTASQASADTVWPVRFHCTVNYFNRDGRVIAPPRGATPFVCAANYSSNGIFGPTNAVSCTLRNGNNSCEATRTIRLMDQFPFEQTALVIARAEKRLGTFEQRAGCVYQPAVLPLHPESTSPGVTLGRPSCTPSEECPYYDLWVVHNLFCANLP